MARRDAIRNAACYVTDNPRAAGRKKLLVRDIIAKLEVTLKAQKQLPKGFCVDKFLAGSAVPFLLSPAYRKDVPGDLDPIFYVSPAVDMNDLRQAFGDAMNQALKTLTGRDVPCATYFKYDVHKNPTLYVRVGMENVLDLRVLCKDSPVKPWDMETNALMLPWEQVMGGKEPLTPVPPEGVSLARVLDFLKRGVYHLDKDLAENSIYRPWKERADGKVPSEWRYESHLLATWCAYLEEEATKDIENNLGKDFKGPALRLATEVGSVLKKVPHTKRAAFLANAVAQLRQYPDTSGKQELIQELSKNLRSQTKNVRGPTAGVSQCMESDAGQAFLTLYFHIIAQGGREAWDATQVPVGLDVERVDVDGTPWLRAFVPAMGWLILPDAPTAEQPGMDMPIKGVHVLEQPLHIAIAELLGGDQPSTLSALVPADAWADDKLRTLAATRLFDMSKGLPDDALHTRARLLSASTLLDPATHTLDALEQMGKGLGDTGASYVAFAQKVRAHPFPGLLETLTNASSGADARSDAWRQALVLLDKSQGPWRRNLAGQLAGNLPALLKQAVAGEFGDLATGLSYVTGDLRREATQACFLLKAAQLNAKKPNRALLQELDRLLANAPGGSSRGNPVLHNALVELLNDNQWTRAWKLAKSERREWATLSGAVAAALLDNAEISLLKRDVPLGLALLERVVETRMPLGPLLRDARRTATFLEDERGLALLQQLLDTVRTPDVLWMRWTKAAQAFPKFLARAVEEATPAQVSFFPAAEALLDTHVEHFPDSTAHLEFMVRIWQRHREAHLDNGAHAAVFIARGLAHLANRFREAKPQALDVPTLQEWFAALRHLDKAVISNVLPLFTSLAANNGAFAEAAEMLLEWAHLLHTGSSHLRAHFAHDAFVAAVGLITPQDAPFAHVQLADRLCRVVPLEHLAQDTAGPNTEKKLWPGVSVLVFLRLVSHGQTRAADAALKRLYTHVASTDLAEAALEQAYAKGTKAEKEAWGNYALQVVAEGNADVNALRLIERIPPPSSTYFLPFIGARHNNKPVPPGDRIVRRLEGHLLTNPEVVEGVHDYLDMYHATPSNPAEREAQLPLMRSYVGTSLTDADGHKRLQHAYAWIGQRPEGPWVGEATASATQREVTMRLLVALTPFILKEAVPGDSSTQRAERSKARYRWLLENLLATPGALGLVENMMDAAEGVLDNPLVLAQSTLLSVVHKALKEKLTNDAFKASVRAMIASVNRILYARPDLAEKLATFLIMNLEPYDAQQREALLFLADQTLRTLNARASLGANAQTEVLAEKLSQDQRVALLRGDVDEEGDAAPLLHKALAEKMHFFTGNMDTHASSSAHALMWRELVQLNLHRLYSGNTTTIALAVTDLLNDERFFAYTTSGQRQEIRDALMCALGGMDVRMAVKDELRGWNDIMNPRLADQNKTNVQLVINAVCETAPLDGEDLRDYLEILGDRRAAAPSETRSTWDNMIQQVVAAAEPGCLRGAAWQNDARLKKAMERIRRGHAANSGHVLMALERLR